MRAVSLRAIAARWRRGGRSSAAAAAVAAVIAVGAVVPLAQFAATPAEAAQNPTTCPTPVSIANGGFEAPVVGNSGIWGSAGTWSETTPGIGWQTTASDGQIELWDQRHGGFAADSGIQFAELNANEESTLYQDVSTTPGQQMGWSLAHRGRSGTDVMRVMIGDPSGALVQSGPDITDGNTAWGTHTGTYTVPAGQTTTRFAFVSVSATGGDKTYGNFLDSISFSNGPCLVASKSVVDRTSTRSGGAANVGDILRYTVSATNNGGERATGVVLSDVIPAGADYVPGSLTITAGGTTGPVTDAAGDDPGRYDASTRTITVNAGAGATASAGGRVEPGSTVTATFDAKVKANATGVIENTASYTYGNPYNSSTSTATSPTVQTPVADAADLSITKTATGSVRVGEQVTYTIVVTNHGPSTASDVSVQDVLPAGLSRAATTTSGCAITEAALDCAPFSLTNGSSKSITIIGTAAADYGDLTNTATVSSRTFDPDTSDNTSAAAVTAVTQVADVSVTKTAAKTSVRRVEANSYTITVSNAGPSTARALTVTDTPGSGLVLGDATASTGSWNAATKVWSVGDLAPNTQATLTVAATYTSSGDIVNEAVASSSTSDPDTADLAARRTVTVSSVTPAAAQPDTGSSRYGQPATVAVLDNDTASTGATFTGVQLLDGVTPVSQIVVAGKGTWTVDSSRRLVFTPVQGFHGEVTASYRATDSDGVSADSTATVTVFGPPNAVADTATTDQDVSVTVPVASNDSANGTATLVPGSVRLIDPANNGALATSVTIPGEGTYTLNTSTGQVEFDPLPTFHGVSTVGYSIADSNGDRSASTVTVTVDAADLPAATNDTAGGAYNTPVVVSPTANDDAGAPHATFVPGSLRLLGADGSEMTTLTVAGEGTYTVDAATGQVSFTPLASFSGPATPVGYTVSTTFGETTGADIAITIAAPAAPAGTADAGSAAYGHPVVLNPLANDSSGPAGTAFVGSTLRLIDPVTEQPTLSVTLAGKGVWTVDPTAGTATFQPAAGFAGAVPTVGYTATTNAGTTVRSTVAATVGAAPVASNDVVTGHFGQPVVLEPTTNDSPGAGAETVASSVRLLDGTGSPVTTLFAPGRGVWSVDGVGKVTFTPESGFHGTADAPYRFTDSDGNTADGVLTVTIPEPPAAQPDRAVTPNGQPVTIDPLSNDSAAAGGAPLDPTTVRLVDPESGDLVTSLRVAGKGVFSVNSLTGRITFAPEGGYTGLVEVTYSVSDTEGNANVATVTVEIQPVAAAAPASLASTGPEVAGAGGAAALLLFLGGVLLLMRRRRMRAAD